MQQAAAHGQCGPMGRLACSSCSHPSPAPVLQRRCARPASASASAVAAGAAAAAPAARAAAPAPRAQPLQPAHHPRRAAACTASAKPAVFLFGFGNDEPEYDDESCTVVKLQVGIFGDISKWQRKFDKMASQYDTDDEEGLHGLLQETLTVLLRNTEYVSYASSGGRVYEDIDTAEAKFNEVSFEERAKCEEETLSNVDGKLKTSSKQKASDGKLKDPEQWMCITLLMAVARKVKLPKISSVYDLQQALKKLAGVTVDDLMAFELLWTPQDEGDCYSKDELLMDYPQMITLT